ncbi:hypothetical protein ICM73_000228 [Shigella flexneri]|nr:hypothetical protein [Shigella flexneri]
MKFKFFYAKHKVTGEFVSMYNTADDEGMIYTHLGLSRWDSDVPYMSSEAEITRLVNGHMNDHFGVILSKDLKEVINKGYMELTEVEI